MTENQKTVSKWMFETFPGTDPESPRKMLRALEEMVELCLAAGASPCEIHDKVIELIKDKTYIIGIKEPEKIPVEAADVLIVLYGVAEMRGFDLNEEVNKKMAINRARKWNVRGDGTRYHVKEDGK